MNEVQTHFSAQLMAITSELNAKTAQLGMREAVLARQYSEYAAATSTYIGKVRAEVGTPGESLGAAGWRNCSSPDGVLSFLRLGELIPPSADLDNRLKPSLRLDKVSVPLFLPFAPGKGLSIEGDGATKLTAVPAVQQLAIRLVAGVPPGKLRFTFIDPIGLGQNVAPLLALGDDIEELVGGRVWSEPTHIEQKLAELQSWNALMQGPDWKERIMPLMFAGLADECAQRGRWLRDGAVVAEVALAFGANYNLTGDGGEPERVGTLRVSSNLLPMLGAQPVAGRRPGDQRNERVDEQRSPQIKIEGVDVADVRCLARHLSCDLRDAGRGLGAPAALHN